MTGTVRKRVTVEGRVQGVYFRATTRREATAMGLSGWVRNLPDGRVEAVFEGPPALVDAAVEWCRRGPERSDVTGVAVEEEPPEGLRGFSVR